MTYLAQYDQLTGLVNRTLFRDRLLQAMARSKRLQRPLGLMLLDLDRFKAVQIADGAVAMLFNVMRALCGPDWLPREVRLAHRRPADVQPFRRFFRAPLRFDAEQYALVMSAHWLGRRLPETDVGLQRLLQDQVDALEARHGDDFPEQVRSVLRTGLLTGHASADQVAALFSMHSRTLTRRLDAHGTSFKTLVDEGRFAIATQMLQNTSLGVQEIAAALDYADASAFTRAFRRWSGTTPAAWRVKRAQPG